MINLRDTGVKKSWMRNVVIVHQISLKGNDYCEHIRNFKNADRDQEYVKPKLEIVEVKIENMWEAAESLKCAINWHHILRLQADKEELKKHREVLFEQIRKATGVKRHKPSSQWPGDKDGFFKRGPRVDHVRSMHPTIWERNLPGSRKYTPVTVSSLDTQHASSSALADLGKNEKFQIAPPNKRHKKKKKTGWQTI
uniref:Uncharacterized protein n=1 Tax=Ditylenchus dipsaci TaxID=166011 RepID=A0A915DUF2_9BILA